MGATATSLLLSVAGALPLAGVHLFALFASMLGEENMLADVRAIDVSRLLVPLDAALDLWQEQNIFEAHDV